MFDQIHQVRIKDGVFYFWADGDFEGEPERGFIVEVDAGAGEKRAARFRIISCGPEVDESPNPGDMVMYLDGPKEIGLIEAIQRRARLGWEQHEKAKGR